MSEVEKVRSDIELTRAELAKTVDALQAKLDVKVIAKQRVNDASERATQAYTQAKAGAPEPVQHALDKVEHAAAPVVAKAAQDKKRTALIAGGTLVALLVLRRLTRNRPRNQTRNETCN